MSTPRKANPSDTALRNLRVEVTHLARALSEKVVGSEERFTTEVLESFRLFLTREASAYFQSRCRSKYRRQDVDAMTQDVVSDFLTPGLRSNKKALANTRRVFERGGTVDRTDVWRHLCTTCRDMCSEVLKRAISRSGKSSRDKADPVATDPTTGRDSWTDVNSELWSLVEGTFSELGRSSTDFYIYVHRSVDKHTYEQIAGLLNDSGTSGGKLFTAGWVRDQMRQIERDVIPVLRRKPDFQ